MKVLNKKIVTKEDGESRCLNHAKFAKLWIFIAREGLEEVAFDLHKLLLVK